MFGTRIPSKSNNGRHAHALCLLFYVYDGLIYDIFLLRYLGAKYDSPETKKHTSPPSTSCLTKPI